MTDLNKTLREYRAIKAASRRAFITRLGSAGIGVAAGAVIAGCGGGGNGFNNPANAAGSGPISEPEVKAAFLDIQKDENDHVSYLISVLGAAVRPRPTFDKALLTVPNEAALWATADALENTGPGAYLHAVPFLASSTTPANVQAAASIAIVEGRHAGFLNILTGKGVVLTDPNATPIDSAGPPQPGDPAGFSHSQEIPQPPSQVQTRAAGFLGAINAGNAPAGANTGTGITYLNGGPGFPNATYTTTSPGFAPSDGNTTYIILNYALFLEYLERDFYNINVSNPAIYGGSPAYSVTGQNS